MILQNCFNREFELIKDKNSLHEFQQKLYNFYKIVISNDSYHFYNQFYRHMINQLEEKRSLINAYGTLSYLNDLQTDLLDLEQEHLGLKFFHKLFDKLKLLFEEAVRDKNDGEF